MIRLLTFALAAALCADPPVKSIAPSTAASTPSTATQPSASSPAKSALETVAFVGASATAGFGVVAKVENHSPSVVAVPFAASFAAVVSSPIAAYDLGSPFFFMSPGSTGRSLVDRAIEKKPTLVVGIDFLFWYVYGDDDGHGGPLRHELDRLKKLELGFRELERFDPSVPIVVGDIPDMSRAVGKMISRTQLPQPDTQKQANDRIRAWVTKRGNAIVFPLAQLVDELKGDQPIVACGVTFANDKGKLIQSDDLHPTLRGSLALAMKLADLMVDGRIADKSALAPTDEAAAAKRQSEAAAKLHELRSGRSADAPKPPASAPADSAAK
ncbi:MAG: hypothetical protein U0572_03790 [Phycisphaerales bacterium]